MCIALNRGSFNAYITPPMVYITPPAKSQPNAVSDIAVKSGLNANIHSHPIIMYIIELSHLGDLIQNTVSIRPHTVSSQISIRSGMPDVLGKARIHIGVYVPAIKKYIIIWSNF